MAKTPRTSEEIRANPSGYKQIKKGALVGSFVSQISSSNENASNTNVIIAESAEKIRAMKADYLKKHLARGDEICLTVNGKNLLIDKVREYSDIYEDESPTYTLSLRTRGIRTIISNVKTFRNPAYADNPECELCHEKSAKLYNDHLLDAAKTPVKVCHKCRNGILKIGRKMEDCRQLNEEAAA